jgi:hypothetical protein
MQSMPIIPRRPFILSDSQPIRIVLKIAENSNAAVLTPPSPRLACLTSFR